MGADGGGDLGDEEQKGRSRRRGDLHGLGERRGGSHNHGGRCRDHLRIRRGECHSGGCIARASWLDTMESLMLEGFSVLYLVASKHDSSFLRWPDRSELQQYNLDHHGMGLTHFLFNRREQSSFILMSI